MHSPSPPWLSHGPVKPPASNHLAPQGLLMAFLIRKGSLLLGLLSPCGSFLSPWWGNLPWLPWGLTLLFLFLAPPLLHKLPGQAMAPAITPSPGLPLAGKAYPWLPSGTSAWPSDGLSANKMARRKEKRKKNGGGGQEKRNSVYPEEIQDNHIPHLWNNGRKVSNISGQFLS